jgi:hypothetical protein
MDNKSIFVSAQNRFSIRSRVANLLLRNCSFFSTILILQAQIPKIDKHFRLVRSRLEMNQLARLRTKDVYVTSGPSGNASNGVKEQLFVVVCALC